MKEKLCETCRYRNNVEQLKPCIIYRDDCEYYEKERGDMTREDIKTIIDIVHKTIYGFFDVCDEEETPMTDKDKLLLKINKAICTNIKALEQEPCGDVISRQVVKDKYKERLVNSLKDDDRRIDLSEYAEEPYKAFCEFIDSIPSVNPQEPKAGHWEWVQYDYNPKLGNWHCSECRCIVVECVDKEEKGGIPLYKYCPQCGAKMVEPQESEVLDADSY